MAGESGCDRRRPAAVCAVVVGGCARGTVPRLRCGIPPASPEEQATRLRNAQVKKQRRRETKHPGFIPTIR